jgi:hypothetical protein
VQSHQAHKTSHHAVTRVAARRAKRAAKGAHAASRHTAKGHAAKSGSSKRAATQRRSAVRQKTSSHSKVAAHRKAGHTGQQAYAARLRSVLDYSTRLFDQAAEAVAASGDLSGLADVCGQYSQQVALAADRAEGVPHPYRWYTRAGRMHHNLMGTYHYMAGALASCQLAAGNGDDQGASLAKTDIAQADRQMHSTDSWAHWLARR